MIKSAITPKRVQELLNNATEGKIVHLADEIYADSRTYKDGLCESGTLTLLEDRYRMFAFEGDKELFLTSKEIALEYLALQAENARLRSAVEFARDDYNDTIVNLDIQCAMAIECDEMKTATAFAMKEIKMNQIRARLFMMEEALKEEK